MGFKPYEIGPPVPDKRKPLKKIGKGKNCNFHHKTLQKIKLISDDQIASDESTSQVIEGASVASSLEPYYENGLHINTSGSGSTKPVLEPLEALFNPDPANLIILNTPPSPSSQKIPQLPSSSNLNCDLLTIPQRKTPISDPVSPNPPWHIELDRRHSDSAASHSFLDNTTEVSSPENTMEMQQHTYQNTNLKNVGAKPKVTSHDQLLHMKNTRQ
mgnify:CR=1 FL=1